MYLLIVSVLQTSSKPNALFLTDSNVDQIKRFTQVHFLLKCIHFTMVTPVVYTVYRGSYTIPDRIVSRHRSGEGYRENDIPFYRLKPSLWNWGLVYKISQSIYSI